MEMFVRVDFRSERKFVCAQTNLPELGANKSDMVYEAQMKRLVWEDVCL